jgi:hypothetical protein
MNFLDPFFLFVSIEIIALLVLLVFWLDLGFSFVYVALHGHVTPEVAALLFPRAEEVVEEIVEALKEESAPESKPEHAVAPDEWHDMSYREETEVAVVD